MSINAFILYACLSSPPQTNHLIVLQHPQDHLRDRKHREGKKLLSDASFRAPLLCRSDGSSQSNFPTISLIKAACRAGEAGGTVAPPTANPPQEDRLHRTLPQDSVHCSLTLHCHIRAFRQSACPCPDNCLKACPCGNSRRRGCADPCQPTLRLTRVSHPRCDSHTDHICERHMVELKRPNPPTKTGSTLQRRLFQDWLEYSSWECATGHVRGGF